MPLSDCQYAARVSFVFNAGAGSLRSSTLRRRLNAGDYDCVPSERAKWVKATDPNTGRKVSVAGLVRRREREINGRAAVDLEGDGAIDGFLSQAFLAPAAV